MYIKKNQKILIFFLDPIVNTLKSYLQQLGTIKIIYLRYFLQFHFVRDFFGIFLPVLHLHRLQNLWAVQSIYHWSSIF